MKYRNVYKKIAKKLLIKNRVFKLFFIIYIYISFLLLLNIAYVKIFNE